jgi:hypothetical protein
MRAPARAGRAILTTATPPTSKDDCPVCGGSGALEDECDDLTSQIVSQFFDQRPQPLDLGAQAVLYLNTYPGKHLPSLDQLPQPPDLGGGLAEDRIAPFLAKVVGIDRGQQPLHDVAHGLLPYERVWPWHSGQIGGRGCRQQHTSSIA